MVSQNLITLYETKLLEQKLKTLKSQHNYLKFIIKNEPSLITFIEGESCADMEIRIFLERFRRNIKNKPFIRNIERIENGELPLKEIRKVVSSCLTHLFIEFEKTSDCPPIFERVNNILQMACVHGKEKQAIFNLKKILGSK